MPAPSEAGAQAALAETEAAMAAALLDPARPGLGDPRFAVHRNNVAAGLVGALAETYPAVERLVGGAFFRAAAAAFVRARPPRSPVLLRWGGDFGDWLAGFPPAAGLPYLPDLARLEWARCEAYHAADARPASPGRLAALAADAQAAARLIPHPSLRLVGARFAVGSLWADVTGPRQGGVDVARPESVLVARPDWAVEVRVVDPPAAAFLALLIAARPLGEIAAAAAPRGFDLTDRLVAAVAAGLIVDIA